MEWNREALTHVYGMHLMQLGLAKANFAKQAKDIHHPFVMEIGTHDEQSWAVVEGEDIALPIATETLSVVILPHLLEYSADPHQVLREVTRVLIEDGEVIIYGFSPWSFMGLISRIRALSRGHGTPSGPGKISGSYLSRKKVMDWLSLLGYEMLEQRKLPLLTWSWWGSLLNTGTYQLTAKRMVIPMSRIRQRWEQRASVATGNIMSSNTSTYSRGQESPHFVSPCLEWLETDNG